MLGKIAPRLKAINPAFFSVTYGAGGSTRDKTLDIVETLQRDQGVPTMAVFLRKLIGVAFAMFLRCGATRRRGRKIL